jgi:predicted RND superfamily exporter protein
VLIPPLIVVIGVPNCIYFLNKFHTSYVENNNKRIAIINMVGRMGIVTLFCNIAAAIGFSVFAFTRSQLLKEFGVVSGINIMLLFFISLIFIPVALSWLPAPKQQHMRYLNNQLLEKILKKVEQWALYRTRWVYVVSLVVVVFSVMGIFKLKSEGFIVDDLPKTDNVYTDLKWFEQNFKGVMPLEIVVDTKKKYGALKMETLQNIDSFSNYIASKPETGKPLSIVEALKFGNQAFYDNDSNSYMLPMQIPASLSNMLRNRMDNKTEAATLLAGFVDTTQQYARVSATMKDIGSRQLPVFLNDLQNKANQIFDSSKYNITLTGSSVTFLEGSRFIINGLKESIFWAFLLIAVAMLWLFKSVRILICSLIPNIIPLVITAGVMGWTGVALKPSTVLVFSVALGIVIDVTIRFLVNYKQELPQNNFEVQPTLLHTIQHTGISIIYTSLVLIAGFIIFCFSHFGGTFSLGWLTGLTLLAGTFTNLVLLPALMMKVMKKKKTTGNFE